MMKNLFLSLVLLVPFSASAFDWHLIPTSLASAKAAKGSAAEIGIYVISYEGQTQGAESLSSLDKDGDKQAVNIFAKVCYGPANTKLGFAEEKPLAPYSCVIDAFGLASTVNKFSTAKNYNNALPVPLTRGTFKSRLASMLVE